jgi:hypothetical protein
MPDKLGNAYKCLGFKAMKHEKRVQMWNEKWKKSIDQNKRAQIDIFIS